MDYSSEPLWTKWGHNETFCVISPSLKNIAQIDDDDEDDEDDEMDYLLVPLWGHNETICVMYPYLKNIAHNVTI